MASVYVDWSAVLEGFKAVVPAPELGRVDNVLIALDGILLGRSLRTEILPHLGPGVLAYLDMPDGARNENSLPAAKLAKVLVTGHDSAGGVAAAIENALRTYLATYAVDPKRAAEHLVFESRDVGGRKITALSPATPFAFVTDGETIVVASSVAAAERALARAAEPVESELGQLRAARFPQAGSFACVDLIRLHDYLVNRRVAVETRLARGEMESPENARRELDEAIAFMALFRQAYATSDIEADASAVHRSAGLIPREASDAP
jgi:hypothetical protein